MANLTFIKDKFVNLSVMTIAFGNILYATDTGDVLYDTEDLKRLQTNTMVIMETVDSLSTIKNPEFYKVYIVLADSTFHIYRNATWETITTTSDIIDILDTPNSFIPATISQNGINSAPRTLASCVYVSDGETVEQKVAKMTKVGVQVEHLIITDGTVLTYDIPIPFENYFTYGNYMEIRMGSVFIDSTRYNITDNKITFLESSYIASSVNKDISFVFIYNTIVGTMDAYSGIDGHYIIDNTIPPKKILGMTSDYLASTEDSSPNSAALYTCYSDLMSQINNIGGITRYCTANGNGSAINVTITGLASLYDSLRIKLRMNVDLVAGATLSVNTLTAVPIYSGTTAITTGTKAGQVLDLVYSAVDNKFYTFTVSGVKLQSYASSYTVTGAVLTIPINISQYKYSTDTLVVYQNGLRLFKGENYSEDTENSGIVLTGYNAKIGDIFHFEIQKVIPDTQN